MAYRRSSRVLRYFPIIVAIVSTFTLVSEVILPYYYTTTSSSNLRIALPSIANKVPIARLIPNRVNVTNNGTTTKVTDSTQQKQQRQVTKDDGNVTTTMTDETTTTTSSTSGSNTFMDNETPPAQILTRGTLNSLAKLDAGDLVECYALSRYAKLKSIFGPVGNSTSNMLIRKSALAFRFMPTIHNGDKEEFELTLEYGPQRTGLLMDKEAMPMVNGMEGEGKFVSWENEGKVYYNLKIEPSHYITAHYIAPITGAVLSKILSLAVEYPSLHPRYQPFEVFSHGKLIIRSSNSDDFVWDMFDQLAKMYVDIKPVLAPKRRKLRLYVDGAEKVSGVGAGMEAAGFLDRFYDCVEQVHRGTFVAAAEEEEDVIGEGNSTSTDDEFVVGVDDEETFSDDDDDVDEDDTDDNKREKDDDKSDASKEQKTENATKIIPADDNNEFASADINATSDEENNGRTQIPTDTTAVPSAQLSGVPSNPPSIPPSQSPTVVPIDEIATSALLSGDGSQVVTTLTPCLATHKTAYVFVDGSMYFKLNMTPPYWEAVAYAQDIPQPEPIPAGKGDLFDWTLALLIVSGFLFGMLIMLSKIGVVRERKVKFWKRDEEEGTIKSYGEGVPHPFGEDVIPLSMGGRSIGRQLSGRNNGYRQRIVAGQQERKESNIIANNGTHQQPGVMEMTSTQPSSERRQQSDVSQEQKNRPPLNTHFLTSQRAAKNPDLVDLPDLRFSSKVAMPVGSATNDNATTGDGTTTTTEGGGIEESDWDEDNFVESRTGGEVV